MIRQKKGRFDAVCPFMKVPLFLIWKWIKGHMHLGSKCRFQVWWNKQTNQFHFPANLPPSIWVCWAEKLAPIQIWSRPNFVTNLWEQICTWPSRDFWRCNFAEGWKCPICVKPAVSWEWATMAVKGCQWTLAFSLITIHLWPFLFCLFDPLNEYIFQGRWWKQGAEVWDWFGRHNSHEKPWQIIPVFIGA